MKNWIKAITLIVMYIIIWPMLESLDIVIFWIGMFIFLLNTWATYDYFKSLLKGLKNAKIQPRLP